jgi:hypothetical protein
LFNTARPLVSERSQERHQVGFYELSFKPKDQVEAFNRVVPTQETSVMKIGEVFLAPRSGRF